MATYTIHIEDTADVATRPTGPTDETPDLEYGVWRVEAEDVADAVTRAVAMHRSSRGPLPDHARITVDPKAV